jgi:hypothetical protein
MLKIGPVKVCQVKALVHPEMMRANIKRVSSEDSGDVSQVHVTYMSSGWTGVKEEKNTKYASQLFITIAKTRDNQLIKRRGCFGS